MRTAFLRFDEKVRAFMHERGPAILRIALGIVFFWFGALKILGISPVTGIIATAYPLFPSDSFVLILGVWEVLIGIGLIGKIFLRVVLYFLWLQMAGVFLSLLSAPELFFFQGNPFLLTVEGEFIVKNLVLVAASLVIGGYETERPKFQTNLSPNTLT